MPSVWLLADCPLPPCRAPVSLTPALCSVFAPQAGSPFREPLIKFLTRHPSQTVELFMMEATLNDPQWSRMFMVRAGAAIPALTQSVPRANCYEAVLSEAIYSTLDILFLAMMAFLSLPSPPASANRVS